MLCRVLENIIAEKLTARLFKYNLLSTNQFGFMPNRSNCSQLLIALNKWYKKALMMLLIFFVLCSSGKLLRDVYSQIYFDVSPGNGR